MRRFGWVLLFTALLGLCFVVSGQAEIVESGTLTSSDGEHTGTWALDDEGVLYFDCAGYGWAESVPDNFARDIVSRANAICYGPTVDQAPISEYYYTDSITRYEVDADNPYYSCIDGMLLSKDGTEFLDCPPGVTGSVTVPDGVKVIGFNAFYESDISEVLLPDSLERLEQQSFWNCDNLKSVVIPKHVNYIHILAFPSRILEAYDVDEANETYTDVDGVLMTKEPYALCLYPGGRTEDAYTAPAVERVENDAFRWRRNIKSVTFPEGLSVIGRQGFYESSIQELHLPSTLTAIGEDAFAACTELTDVHFAGTMAQWKGIEVKNGNDSLVFNIIHCADGDYTPDAITGSIGSDVTYSLTFEGDLTVSGAGYWNSNAFENNKKVRHALLRDGVTQIGWSAFRYCDALESVLIPDTVEEIRMYAFYGCSNLKALTIPASVKSINGEVFERCGRLRHIYFGGTMDAWNDMVSPDDNSGMLLCTVHCADGDIEPAYKTSDSGDVYELSDTTYMASIDQNYSLFGSGALPEDTMNGWYGPKTIDIWEGITEIGGNSLCHVNLLTTLYLPASLEAIGDDVLNDCPKLERVYYAGTRAQWAQVAIGENVNPQLEALLVCADDEDYPRVAPAFGKQEYTFEGFVLDDGAEGFSAGIGGGVWLTNYDELKSVLSGDPTWTLEWVSGAELNLGVGNSHPYLAEFIPADGATLNQPAEATYRVTCSWGGQSAEATVRLILREFDMGLPSIDLPDKIDEQPGVTDNLFPAIAPADWAQEGVTPRWRFESGSDAVRAEYDRWNGPVWLIDFDREGEFEGTFYLELGNVTLTKTITFHVAEDHNDLDFCSWNGHDEATYYLGVDDDPELIENDAFQVEPFVTQYWLNDHERMRGELDGDPVFSYSVDGSAAFNIEPHGDWDQPAIDVYLVELPDAPEVDVLHLACDWEERHWELDYRVTFKASDDLPGGVELSFDEPLTFVAGTEFFAQDMIAFSDGWTNPDGFYDVQLQYAKRGDWFEDWDYVRWDDDRDHECYTLNDWGEYTARLKLISDKLIWQHDFTVRVSDENGYVPRKNDIEFWPWYYHDETVYYLGVDDDLQTMESDKLQVDPLVNEYWLDEYEEVRAELDGDPVFSYSVDGTAVFEITPHASYVQPYIEVKLVQMPDAPETDIVRLSCEWDGRYWGVNTRVTFKEAPASLPGGVELSFDEPLTFVAGTEFNPRDMIAFSDGWNDEDEGFRDAELTYNDNDGWRWVRYTEEDGPFYTLDEYGDFVARLKLISGRLVWLRDFNVHVTDENGDVPLFSTYYEKRYEVFFLDMPIVDDEGDEGVRCDNVLGSFGVTLTGDQEAQAGEPAVWSVKQLQGTAKIRLRTWDDRGFYGNLSVEEAPSAAETDVFELSVTYDGQTITREVTATFDWLPDGVGLPTGIEAPVDMVFAQVGVPITDRLLERASFANGWHYDDARNDRYTGYNVSSHWTEAGLVCDRAGCFTAEAHITCNNIDAYKRVPLVVIDEEGVLPAEGYSLKAERVLRLPEDLTSIGEEAFSGLAPDGILEVHVPAGVVGIDERAFDGCDRVLVFTDSEYVKSYCLAHGLIPVMD